MAMCKFQPFPYHRSELIYIKDCGEALYDDFRDDDPEEPDELERCLVNDSAGYVQHPAGSSSESVAIVPISPVASASSVSSTGNSANIQVRRLTLSYMKGLH
jgi:hypothetical protein